jgi:SAM-dependent methyltransferase
MNELWTLLRCPASGEALTLEVFEGPAEAPRAGVLRAPGGAWYPVVDGIPRIFTGEMRVVYERDFADFLARHGLSDGAPVATRDRATRAKLATRDSFGYEWTHFHEMLPEWEENARYYFEPVGGADTLRGQLVLDGGCGKGRHAYYALRAGARVVAVDFSRAIDVAAHNCGALPGERLFVQADLMSLPFSPEIFDAVYSFGVLHHLPAPEEGFRRLVTLVRPGGQILFYVYHALEGEPLKQAILGAVTAVRRLTTRMPPSLLLPLTTALGYGLYGTVVAAYRLLRQLPPTRALAERFPLRTYADYPVRVIVNDQFDRFSAPLEHRYRRADVEAWVAHAHLEAPTVLPGHGWRVSAVKPEAAAARL